jgi:hypothetical protein
LIVYAFERILFGANVAKLLLSDIDCIVFEEHWAEAKEATSRSECLVLITVVHAAS